MTSEVLMLNKNAVVIAADSAVTTGRDPHPRYSKTANKIFDLSRCGNVAVTIFAAAEIDCVPWELALKQFRQHDAKKSQHPKLEDYVGAVVGYLEGNTGLFPPGYQNELLMMRLFQAALFVLQEISQRFPDFVNEAHSEAQRTAAWSAGVTSLSQELALLGIATPLTNPVGQELQAQASGFHALLIPELAKSKEYVHADVTQLTTLAIDSLLKRPFDFLGYTGLVFAGYGEEEIFPSFVHVEIYGHIGKTLLWKEVNRYAITHSNDALILPFAQSSMIDRFTDGFDQALMLNVTLGSMDSFNSIISDLEASGIVIPAAVSGPIITRRHTEFIDAWKRKNWEANFHPLRRVLNSLSVPEMGHLAGSLLVLEELRERVTSPSESIGGPIDIAAITKSEGLVWLKRKHFFQPELNQRYAGRINSEYT
jgi:hypothetical protein